MNIDSKYTHAHGEKRNVAPRRKDGGELQLLSISRRLLPPRGICDLHGTRLSGGMSDPSSRIICLSPSSMQSGGTDEEEERL